MRSHSLVFAALTAALLVGCGDATVPRRPALGSFGVDLALIDPEVRPGDDFFRYVNGTWLATFQIPADKSRYGVVDALRDGAEENVHAIVEALAASSPGAGTAEQKVADLFSSWMNTEAVEARGIAPLTPLLGQIETLSSKTDLMRLIGSIDYTSPFGVSIYPDPADPTRYAVWISQSGLGMPNRDYYLREGDRFDVYRAAYRTYVAKVFELVGDSNPAASAELVIGLENKIAEVHWPPERQRNISEVNNPMDRAGLAALAPEVEWSTVLATLGLERVSDVVVNETTAIRDGAKLLDSEPLETWQKYLTFHVVNDNTASLPQAFDEASFQFYSGTLRGIEQQRERWKRGVALLDGLIGEGVGEAYVARHFPAENKAKMDELVENLQAALRSRLETLPWMDETTRAAALTKLSTFEPRIGYPSKWRDYSTMAVEPGMLFENVRGAREFEWRRQVARLDEPVDRAEWNMNPQTVNAYYNPFMNQITFPAAILQPPIFDVNADSAVNYGAIGAIIGHEIGHGFDDQGREFDEAGKIRNWWTEETNGKFVAATARLGAQYDQYCPLPDTCVNGQFTMGENIGDLGGLQMAYTAYRLSLQGQEAPTIDGTTGDQRFFMAYAQAFRGLQRDDALRNQITTDPHSPGMYRVNGSVRNLDAWYDAFEVQADDALYLPPEERVRIW